MPTTSNKLLTRLSNTKTRTFVLFFGILLLGGIFIAFSKKDTSKDVLAEKGSQTVAPPPQIKATPGSIVSTEYKQLQTAENLKRAEKASASQTSAIPTITGSTTDLAVNQNQIGFDPTLKTGNSGANPQLQFGEAGEPDFISGPFAKSATERERERQEARLLAERNRIEKIRSDKEKALLEQQTREREERLADQERKAYQEDVTRIAGQMKRYANGAYDEWSKYPKQNFVQGALANKSVPSEPKAITPSGQPLVSKEGAISLFGQDKQNAGKAVTKKPNPRNVIKAGTILFGVLETSVNTDEPGPVLATIINGKYSGARLLGSLKHEDKQEAVSITFNQMNIPKRVHSVSVSVVAIDPDTARTALASDVNHHYLLRYGTLFASSFLAGYGEALQQQGSTTTVSPLTGATSTTYPPLNNRQIFLSALSEVGTQWANATRSYFNTPITVTVDQGTGVGLLFMTDTDVSEDS